jgi:hypothetical protein
LDVDAAAKESTIGLDELQRGWHLGGSPVIKPVIAIDLVGSIGPHCPSKSTGPGTEHHIVGKVALYVYGMLKPSPHPIVASPEVLEAFVMG